MRSTEQQLCPVLYMAPSASDSASTPAARSGPLGTPSRPGLTSSLNVVFGFLPVPEGPGLGVDIDEAAVRKVAKTITGLDVEAISLLVERGVGLFGTDTPSAGPMQEVVDVHRIGPQIEHDPRFPNRTNVEFVAPAADENTSGCRLMASTSLWRSTAQ